MAGKYRLRNIGSSSSDFSQMRIDTIYSELVDPSGKTVMSASLEYVISAIQDRGLDVDGVTPVVPPDQKMLSQLLRSFFRP